MDTDRISIRRQPGRLSDPAAKSSIQLDHVIAVARPAQSHPVASGADGIGETLGLGLPVSDHRLAIVQTQVIMQHETAIDDLLHPRRGGIAGVFTCVQRKR